MMGGMMSGFGSGWGGLGSFGLIGMILNLAITIGLIVGLVLLVAWLWRRVVPGGQGLVAPQGQVRTGTSPKDILQVRYAQGEITREQYQQMLADLSWQEDVTMMGLGFGVFGLLFMLLFWGGMIALAIWLVSALFPRNGRGTTFPTDRDLSPYEILDRRYARGEISREQYELMKQDLG